MNTTSGLDTPSGWDAELDQLLRRLRGPATGAASRSLRWIARRSGYSTSYLSEIFNGYKAPTPDTAAAIVTALGGTAQDVVTARAIAARLKQPSIGRAYHLRPYPHPFAAGPDKPISARPDPPDRLTSPDQLAELAAWRDVPAALGLVLLHGGAGAGKSTLFDAFARRCRSAGWVVLTAHWPAIPDAPPRHRRRPTQRLILVEDADLWPVSRLTEVIGDCVSRGSGITRIVLIGRSAGHWWHVLRTRLERGAIPAQAMRLRLGGGENTGDEVRERRRWSLMQAAAPGDSVGEALEDLTIAACLAGPLPYDQATLLGNALGFTDVDRRLHEYTRCCAPAKGGTLLLHPPGSADLLSAWSGTAKGIARIAAVLRAMSSLDPVLQDRINRRLAGAAQKSMALHPVAQGRLTL